jgi:hypothetical protein
LWAIFCPPGPDPIRIHNTGHVIVKYLTRVEDRGDWHLPYPPPLPASYSISQFLCPFALYYLRYAVRSFFTLSRISLADGKTAGQKVHRKIAAAVQKVKSPLLFVPLF